MQNNLFMPSPAIVADLNRPEAVAIIEDMVARSPGPRREMILSAFGGAANYNALLNTVTRMDNKVDAYDHLLTSHDLPNQIKDFDQQWNNGNRPSIPSVALAWMPDLGMSPNSPVGQATLLTAFRAEMVKGTVPVDASLQANEPRFHSRVHTMSVFQAGALQLKMVPLDPFAQGIVTIGTAGHDMDYPGTTNPKGMGSFNEKNSYRRCVPLVAAVYGDAPEGQIMKAHLKTALRFTDATGPHRDLLDAMKHIEAGHTNWDKAPASLKDKFAAGIYYESLPQDNAWQAYANIHNADLMFSVGAGGEMLLRTGLRLNEESRLAGENKIYTTPAGRDYVVNNIMAGGFIGKAGRRLYPNPVLNFNH
jgi:hypothetical protein